MENLKLTEREILIADAAYIRGVLVTFGGLLLGISLIRLFEELREARNEKINREFISHIVHGDEEEIPGCDDETADD